MVITIISKKTVDNRSLIVTSVILNVCISSCPFSNRNHLNSCMKIAHELMQTFNMKEIFLVFV